MLLTSMRRRLIALHLLAVLAAAVILPLALYWRVSATARDLHRRALSEQAGQVALYLRQAPDGGWRLDLPARLRELYGAGYGRYAFAVVGSAGRTLFASDDPAAPLLADIPRGASTRYIERQIDGATLFGAAVPVDGGGERLWVEVLEDQAHRDVLIDDIVAEFLPHAAWVVIPILLVLLGADLVIFNGALRPLTRASRLAARIGPSRVDLRLPERDMPRELRPLVRGVNDALDRIEAGITQQRAFVADAAHELRTPLAVLRARAEALDSSLVGPLIVDIDAMTRIVGQLLDVADSEALTLRADETADLARVAAEVAAFLAPVALAAGKEVAVLGADRPVLVMGNEGALFRAARNLVENAIRHTKTGTTVGIEVGDDGSLAVRDAGQGVPEAERALVFQRFWRADRRQAGGAGLGLAIVARTAQVHGGTVRVESAPGGGAVFTLALRRAAVDGGRQSGSSSAP